MAPLHLLRGIHQTRSGKWEAALKVAGERWRSLHATEDEALIAVKALREAHEPYRPSRHGYRTRCPVCGLKRVRDYAVGGQRYPLAPGEPKLGGVRLARCADCARKRIEINLEWLARAYELEGRSSASIARELGCSIYRVQRGLNEAGVQQRDTRPKVLLKDRDWLEVAYATKSIAEIAVEADCAWGTVYRALRRHAITTSRVQPSKAAYALYRFYDPTGDLLYIGITGNIEVRLKAHGGKSRWTEVSRIELEHFPDALALNEAERAAVIAETPPWNLILFRDHAAHA